MKKITSAIIFTGLIAGASAQTVIDITGSTAGRAAVHNAIIAVLSGETYAHDNASTPTSATRAIYNGTFGGNAYTIRTFWAGSVNGVRDVAQGIQQSQFLATSIVGTAAGQPSVSSPLAPTSAQTVPEIGFSDVFQNSTEFTSPALTIEDEVGIIPFKWYKNDGASASLTNINSLNAQSLYGSLGELAMSQFTGVPADNTKVVYATGRNADSGSRLTVMADIGYGLYTPVNQFTFTVTSGAITANAFAGNSGYGSGSNVAGVLAATWNTDSAVVGYLGSSDWATADTGGATALSYNGVPYSVQAVQEGQYTLWGYLHMNRMALTGNALAFYNALRNEITANPGALLIKDDVSMKVRREGDGAPIGSK
jgi:hypothetical protein